MIDFKVLFTRDKKDIEKIEKLYLSNKTLFKKEFEQYHAQLSDEDKASDLHRVWHYRLKQVDGNTFWLSKKQFYKLFFLGLLAGLLIKLPYIFDWDKEFFYTRNASFVIFPILCFYFFNKHKMKIINFLIFIFISILLLVYINFLPDDDKSDTILLAIIHTPLLLWIAFYFFYSQGKFLSTEKVLSFLRFNGEFLIFTALLVMAGGLFSLLTIGLFNLIKIDINKFYVEYVVIIGLSILPIVSTFIVDKEKQLLKKTSSIIASFFTPLVLVALVIYLSVLLFSPVSMMQDREFLILFNALLLAVMSLIFFSITEIALLKKPLAGIIVLISLCVLTIIIDMISVYILLNKSLFQGLGWTPNRIVIFTENILILIHLIVILLELMQSIKHKSISEKMNAGMKTMIPIYGIWILFLVLLFPLIFNFS